MLVREKQLAYPEFLYFFEGLASHTAGEKPGRNEVVETALVLLGFLFRVSGGRQANLLIL